MSAAYEACVLRYANTDFFATASAADYDPSAAYYVWWSGSVDQTSLDDARSRLMNQLAKTAADITAPGERERASHRLAVAGRGVRARPVHAGPDAGAVLLVPHSVHPQAAYIVHAFLYILLHLI